MEAGKSLNWVICYITSQEGSVAAARYPEKRLSEKRSSKKK